jgi:DNA-binding NarL/FixJ family response regulator
MRIVIAEDSTIVREGLVALLTGRGIDVVAAVGDGVAAVDATLELRPDVLVTDVRMPPTFTDEGLRVALEVTDRAPDVGVLVFSQYVETRYARELFAAGRGGVGYLLKDRVADVAAFVDALRSIAAGNTVLDPEVVTQLFAPPRAVDALAAVSDRERDVLRLMAEGRTNQAIADALFLTPGTIEKHIASVFQKLGLQPSAGDHRRVLAVLKYLSA